MKPSNIKHPSIPKVNIQQYERYLPTAFDDSLSLLEKINRIIHSLHEYSKLTIEMIEKWNEVYDWVLNDGLTQAVHEKLHEWLDDGTFNEIINEQIFSELNDKINNLIIELHDFIKKIDDIFVNPVIYGLNDESEDNSQAIIEAINSIKNTGGTIIFPQSKNFKMNEVIGDIKGSNITIDLNGSTLDFSGMTPTTVKTLLRVVGEYGSVRPLLQDGISNEKVVYCNTVGLKQGDYVKIQSNKVWDSERTQSKHGEINQVDYIISDSQMVLVDHLQSSYETENMSIIKKVTFSENVIIKNGTIKGSKENNQWMGLYFEITNNCKVVNMKTENIDIRHIVFSDSVRFNVESNTIETSNHENQAYGVSVADASSDGIITNNHFVSVRHSLSTNNHTNVGGIVRRILFSNNTVENSTRNLTNGGGGDAIDTHAGCEEIYIINNSVNNSSGYGINFEGRTGIIRGNRIKNAHDGGIHFNPWADIGSSVVISDNYIQGITTDELPGYGIAVIIRTGNASNIIINNNRIDSPNNSIRVHANDVVVNRLSIVGNVLNTTVYNNSISLQNINYATISGNSITGQTVGLYCVSLNHTTITGNSIILTNEGTSVWGMRLTGERNIISSNVIRKNFNPESGSHGISLTSASNNNGVFSNLLQNFNTKVYIHASSNDNVEDNNI